MKQQGNVLIILSILVVLSLGVIFYYVYSKPENIATPYQEPSIIKIQPTSTNSVDQTKPYQSMPMKFNVELPVKFQAVEKPGRITFSNTEGNIIIDRNGTNFISLKDYLVDLDSRNKVQISEETQLTINQYSATNRLIKYQSGEIQKIYIIFVSGFIYNFQTDSQSLYDDLDQIAKSFRYIP
ncbi:hypothetical protein A3B39_01970 [Candidatus Daviesbacteria bacterium RIFCSPLOWO2_01_FULL_37_10]|nr:MAG: hypothetical protein A3B39_01970 [Candidatus Daviesbacteria bacterium RIFCSPLOWO2_01_FULL_37_10]